MRIVQKILINITINGVQKHGKDLEYGISPHTIKCTYYHDQLLQMGLCQLDKIEELN